MTNDRFRIGLKIITIGKLVIPLWIVLVILVSGVASGVLGFYVWKTLTIPVEVKEPIEILYYPSQLSLYPEETLVFNVTVEDYASINYSVGLDFQLSNATYQSSYVTFSNYTYIVIHGQQNLTAWMEIEADAPPANLTLTLNFSRTLASVSIELEQVTNSTNSWEVSGNLTAGNTYVLEIHSSLSWRDDWDGGGYVNPQPVEVVITSPDGANTTLEAYFYAPIPTSGGNASTPAPLPSNVEVKYISVDSNSLSVDYSYPQPCFTVKSGGNYTAAIIYQVSKLYPQGFTSWAIGPPANMILEQEVVEYHSVTSFSKVSILACQSSLQQRASTLGKNLKSITNYTVYS